MDVTTRARMFAALGDRVRLAMVDDLAASDRAPVELAERHGLASNLLAHHLDVLEHAGLIERSRSSGDGRRRYVRLRHEVLDGLGLGVTVPELPVVFVCTHNSARSQLAAAVWSAATAAPALSAGTHPADRVHPGAVAAAARHGYDLTGAAPRSIDDVPVEGMLVVTVCDRAHEELEPGPDWLHWSIPDPVERASPAAFDGALRELETRIESLTGGHHGG
jgi:ArsR family transcriptional regulator, arsenate/arsenite/antimonite-responsive transcriptional repressor / arsenate reductase (thioredoxin)